jgi:hypothetical protein
VVFDGVSDGAAVLARWLVDDSRDEAIEEKEVTSELFKLVGSRLGLPLDTTISLPEARSKVMRYTLVNELRGNVEGPLPAAASMIPEPPSRDHLAVLLKVNETLRQTQPDVYEKLAGRVESELGLAPGEIDPAALKATTPFRFQERAILRRCGEHLANAQYGNALRLIAEHGTGFWVVRSIKRLAQWEACRLMAELGDLVEAIRPALRRMGDDPRAWVRAYAEEGGWHRVDLIHRKLEAHVATMDEEPEEEKALAAVRRAYEDLLAEMAERFSRALQQAGWVVPEAMHQTRVFPDVVEATAQRTAYFLVDAMRFEMGVELTRLLHDAADLSVCPAVAAIPTITKVGMAALLPGSSGSFTAVEQEGKLGARIQGGFLPSLQARQKFLKARVPDAVDITMGKVLQSPVASLRRTLGQARLIVVRSQAIDDLGEGGDDLLARQIMDTVVGNVARAVRKLASLGVDRFAITADHGYQFSSRKEEDMRIEAPGGHAANIRVRSQHLTNWSVSPIFGFIKV